MTDLIKAAEEARAIARGEEPAPRIHVQGHAYVPEERFEELQARIEILECAIKLQSECEVRKAIEYPGVEDLEVWEWHHPDGRSWTDETSWEEIPVMHPELLAALQEVK